MMLKKIKIYLILFLFVNTCFINSEIVTSSIALGATALGSVLYGAYRIGKCLIIECCDMPYIKTDIASSKLRSKKILKNSKISKRLLKNSTFFRISINMIFLK